MKRLALVAIVGAGALGRAEEGTHELPPSVVFARLAPSVVVIKTKTKDNAIQGSGVAVGKEQIITNYHVVDGAQSIEVRQGDRSWGATLAAFDPKHDLALLKVAGFDGPKVPLRASSLVKVGDKVYAIGAPRGLELSLSDGLIAALRPDKRDGRETGASILQTTAPVSPGSSGGGLFDAQGRLVGVTTFVVEGGQNLNFAHPTEWIVELQGGRATGSPAVRATTGTPTSTSSSAASSAPSSSATRFTLSERPQALRCTLQTATTWGLFSGGAEILETKRIRGTWDFDAVNSQLPRALAVPPFTLSDEELVLADLNRQTGFIRFSPTNKAIKAEYFFFVDDEGAFQMAVLQPVDFHGQLRALVTSGGCDPLSSSEMHVKRRPAIDPYGPGTPRQRCDRGEAPACLEAARAEGERGDRTAALRMLIHGCDLGSRRACEDGAALSERLGFAPKADALRKKAAELDDE